MVRRLQRPACVAQGKGHHMFRRGTDGKYEIECDGECGAVLYSGLKSFHQARNLSVVEGWEHRKGEYRDWQNYCPSCSEEINNPELDRVGLHFFRKVANE
jgi:hypothetical protein